MNKYRKRPGTEVTAVRFVFDSDGFEYRKWGDIQKCKEGDWIVHNGKDTYTIDAESFAETYAETSPGRYRKTTPVWARVATADGVVKTKEGTTAYSAGDYIVCNKTGEDDKYAVSKAEFERMYEEVPAESP